MKNILLDFCLVLLVLMLAGQFLNPDYLKTEQQKSKKRILPAYMQRVLSF